MPDLIFLIYLAYRHGFTLDTPQERIRQPGMGITIHNYNRPEPPLDEAACSVILAVTSNPAPPSTPSHRCRIHRKLVLAVHPQSLVQGSLVISAYGTGAQAQGFAGTVEGLAGVAGIQKYDFCS